jgi:hypothetical protein
MGMKRILGHVASIVAVGLAVSAALPACATNDESIFIRGALAPASQRVNGACVYTSDPQQTELFEGAFDVGLSDNYFAVLLVGNQMIGRGDPQNNRAESNRAHITGAIVRVTEPDGTQIGEFTSYAVGFADPQNNNTPGFATIGVTVIDALTSGKIKPKLTNRTLTKQVILFIKAFGKSLGGKDLESGEFQFPIQVCNGCLVDFTQGYEPTSKTQPRNCDKAFSSTGGATTGGPCIIGQDAAVNCQLCKGVLAVCDPNTP